MINKIRQEIKENIGKTVHLKVNGSRNKCYEYIGTIENAYKNIFTININNNLKNSIMSFNYADILIGSLDIIIK